MALLEEMGGEAPLIGERQPFKWNWISRLAVVVLVPILGVVACGWRYNGSYTYRITINVDTPEGLRSGSAIRHFTVGKTIDFIDTGSRRWSKMDGEAVAVDLGKRGWLFAPLSSPGDDDNSVTIVIDAINQADGINKADIIAQQRHQFDAFEFASAANRLKGDRQSRVVQLLCKSERIGSMSSWSDGSERPTCPVIVKFDKLEDPASAVRVPLGSLDQAFGTGVRLKSITIEFVDGSPTRRISTILPWLNAWPGSRNFCDAPPGSYPDCLMLTRANFERHN